MALEFTEYMLPKVEYGVQPDVPYGIELATQSIAIGGGSVQSAAFDAKTRLIVVTKIDADARIAIGPNPAAVAGGLGQTRYLKAGSEYAFAVDGGQKLAVINA